jgi:hypothetical protein
MEDTSMRKFYRNALGVVAAALMVGTSLVAIPSEAAAPGGSAAGHGTLLVQDENGRMVRRQFSFNGRQVDGFEAEGSAVLHNPAFTVGNGQNYSLHIDVQCLKIVGNIAIFGGLTRRTNDPNLVDAVFFTVQDNGEPGKNRDKISRVFFWDDDPTTQGDPMACANTGPTDFPLETIDAGNVQVRP